MTDDLRPPFRQQFDNARDPYTARNALGITSTGGSGSGFITAVTPPLQVTGTTLSIDLSAYLTTATAAATYQPLDGDLTAIAALTGTSTIYYRSGTNTWSPVTIGSNMTFAGGTLNAVAGSSVTDVIPHCGRLEYVSTTALSFKPYNGDRIKINGTIYAIPSAGITGLANTGVFVGGVAGQNLAANGVYNVYAFNNAGTITADFIGAGTAHVASTTAGNVGTEIKTGDDTRTLIGKVTTDVSSQFQYSPSVRCVIGWFNRRNIPLIGALVGGASTASTTLVELGTAARVYFLAWGDEGVIVSTVGLLLNSTAVTTISISITLDGAANIIPQYPMFTVPAVSYNGPAVAPYAYLPSEGLHYFNALGATSSAAAAATFYVSLSGMIRG